MESRPSYPEPGSAAPGKISGGTAITLANQLAETIRARIVSGKLPAGSVFPNENDFCAELGVGRGTLREAYKILESQGFLSRTKRGTFVNSMDEIAGRLPLGTAIEMSDFEDLMEFRVQVEAGIAALAAQRATGEDIETLAHTLAQMQKHTAEHSKLAVYDTLFHLQLASASRNRLFSSVVYTIMDVYTASMDHIFQTNRAISGRAVMFHRRILDAVRVHDAAAARAVMQEHIEDVMNYEAGIPNVAKQAMRAASATLPNRPLRPWFE